MNVLDLFSGIGGFSLGLERAGMHTDAAKDFSGSLKDGYSAIRERVAAGGEGWKRGEI